MHWPIALVQLFFTLGWTVYVIFLPGLLKVAGIDLSWLPWILIIDQLLFAAADVATGVWLDRSEQFMRKAGNWITALVLVACAVFVLLPFMAQSMPAWLFLPALFVWVICSSVLRVPPLVLLAKYATPQQPASMRSPIAAYLFGLGLAGAMAPYLTVLLKSRDPLLPFVIASVALALTTMVLCRQLSKPALASAPAPSSAPTLGELSGALPLLIAVGLFAFGMQIHAAINSAKLFTRIAPGVPLEWLMPMFWAGFSVAMFPATVWLSRGQSQAGRISANTASLLWQAGLIGGIALVACSMAPPLPWLITLQIVAGAAWGVVFLAAISAAASLGHTGREGGWIGATLALIALATVARIALVLALAPANSGAVGSTLAAQLPWVTGAAWLLGAGLLGLWFMQRGAAR